MTPVEIIVIVVNLAVVSVALGVFVYLLFTGRLSERQLRLGPTRDLHQPKIVYLIGIYLPLRIPARGRCRKSFISSASTSRWDTQRV